MFTYSKKIHCTTDCIVNESNKNRKNTSCSMCNLSFPGNYVFPCKTFPRSDKWKSPNFQSFHWFAKWFTSINFWYNTGINVSKESREQIKCCAKSLTDPRGHQGHRLTRGPNSFIFMEFSANKLRNNTLAHPPFDLAPPQENPGWSVL